MTAPLNTWISGWNTYARELSLCNQKSKFARLLLAKLMRFAAPLLSLPSSPVDSCKQAARRTFFESIYGPAIVRRKIVRNLAHGDPPRNDLVALLQQVCICPFLVLLMGRRSSSQVCQARSPRPVR